MLAGVRSSRFGYGSCQAMWGWEEFYKDGVVLEEQS